MQLDPKLLVIHDAKQRQWLKFEHPMQVLIATSIDQVVDTLVSVENLVSQNGWYAAGYVGYQAAAAFDPNFITCRGGELPLVWFGLYESAEVFVLPHAGGMSQELSWRSRLNKQRYWQSIASIKAKIADGETYQVNYTYPLDCAFTGDAWDFFVALQHAQQGAYGAFLDLGRYAVCSASPELFFSREADLVATRPMKGTTARGANPQLDNMLRVGLAHSTKDRAENLMIVDMLRNDLGRIADPGSITVDELFHIEEYPTLWQMTSQVYGRCNCALVELFRVLFPCASITGAPKVKSMEIIAELENMPRQIYTGSIGFMLPGGRTQFNVAIRTALIDRQHGCAEYPVGGGIVWDSDVEDEYEETTLKAQVLSSLNVPCLLETLLWEPATGYRFLELHLQRLCQSATHFSYPVHIDKVRQILIAEAAKQQPGRWRVRCLVGVTGVVEVQFFPQPYRGQSQALQLAMADSPIASGDEFYRHKTDNRQRFEHVLSVARKNSSPAVDDVILYNEREEITETSMANIVVYVDGQWITPPLHCGLLPGTFRQKLLNDGVIVEQVITRKQLSQVDCLYLINSVRGWRWAEIIVTLG